jgi:hypothetical protein
MDKYRYEVQEQNGVAIWYTGIYRPISSTDYGNDDGRSRTIQMSINFFHTTWGNIVEEPSYYSSP